MPNPINPHFAMPFKFGANGHADVVEQGSIEDHAQQVEAVIRTIKGTRLDLPEFGINELALHQIDNGDLISILRTIDRWAPDASVLISQNVDAVERMTVRIHIDVLKGVDE